MNVRWTWAAGLVVAAAAAVATAHGGFEVARAAGVPVGIAGLYPAISDGLALVAYAATVRLDARPRRYAWTVVVVAAGLSGTAQAAWLSGGVRQVPVVLRFGVGAWPAVAAAVVAHLLFLLGATHGEPVAADPPVAHLVQPVFNALDSCLDALSNDVRDEAPVRALHAVPPTADVPVLPDGPRERAKSVARAEHDRTGRLPSVSELAAAAEVSRGTAATALRHLRTGHSSAAERPSEGVDR